MLKIEGAPKEVAKALQGYLQEELNQSYYTPWYSETMKEINNLLSSSAKKVSARYDSEGMIWVTNLE